MNDIFIMPKITTDDENVKKHLMDKSASNPWDLRKQKLNTNHSWLDLDSIWPKKYKSFNRLVYKLQVTCQSTLPETTRINDLGIELTNIKENCL